MYSANWRPSQYITVHYSTRQSILLHSRFWRLSIEWGENVVGCLPRFTGCCGCWFVPPERPEPVLGRQILNDRNIRLRRLYSGFSRTHKIGNIGIIANFIFSYLQFFLYLHHMMLVNVKIYVSGCKKIIFEDCRLHHSSSFLMAQLKWSWQYWHFCITESLWKTPLHHWSKNLGFW